MAGERHAPVQQEANPAVIFPRAGKDQPVGEVVAHDMQDRRKAVGARDLGKDRQVIAGPGQRPGQPRQQFVGEAQYLLMRVKNQADDLGAPGAQALCRTVGDIAQPFGGLGHGLPCRFGDLGVLGQRPADGRDRKAGIGGQRAQGRPGPCGAFLLPDIACHAPSPSPRKPGP